MTDQELIEFYPTIDTLPLNSTQTVTCEILRAVAAGELRDDLLLIGKNGSGKTTLARLLPMWFYHSIGEPYWYPNFIDAISQFKPATVRYQLQFWSWRRCDFDWTILDEVDKTTASNINELHSLLGVFGGKGFILTANTLEKLPEGIESRCRTLLIHAPLPIDYLPYAQRQLRDQGKNVPDDQVLAVLQAAVKFRQDLRLMQRAIVDLARQPQCKPPRQSLTKARNVASRILEGDRRSRVISSVADSLAQVRTALSTSVS